MKLLAVMALLLASLTATGDEQGRDPDGNRLLEYCEAALDKNNSRPDGRALACAAYVRGFIDGMGLAQASQGDTNDQRICLPLHVSIVGEQGIRIIVKYLKDHPEKLHLPQQVLTYLALNEAFPCPGNPVPHVNKPEKKSKQLGKGH